MATAMHTKAFMIQHPLLRVAHACRLAMQDPTEGEALAAALLERLAATARLTYATTHHAGLKDLAAVDPQFINACVEFDVASLRPTYR